MLQLQQKVLMLFHKIFAIWSDICMYVHTCICIGYKNIKINNYRILKHDFVEYKTKAGKLTDTL